MKSSKARSRRSSTKLQWEVGRLAEAADIRVLPLPPAFLREDAQSTSGEGIAGDADSWRIEILTPHWNLAVRQLGVNGSRYFVVQKVLGALGEEVGEIDDQLQLLERRLSCLDRILDAIKSEVDRAGLDATVGDTLGGRSHAADEWHSWEAEIDKYFLEPREPDHDWVQVGRSVRRACTAYAEDAWRDVLERATAVRRAAENKRELLRKERAVYRFRMDIIEQVLREFELLGYVLPLQYGMERRFTSRDLAKCGVKERLFIVAAAESFVKHSSHQKPSRNLILEDVDEMLKEWLGRHPLLAEEVHWRDETAKEVAKSKLVFAYPFGPRDGRQEPKVERDLCNRFRKNIEARMLVMNEAGVNTLKEVFKEWLQGKSGSIQGRPGHLID